MERTKNNYWLLVLVIVIAVFVRFYDFDLGHFSTIKQDTSTMISVLLGVLSVIGLYFLVKELFDERLAALSSFLLAVSSWHIYLSRSGSKEVFASFVLIFALYFLWHGLKYSHTFNFFIAGLFGGAGFYAGKIYFLSPLIFIFLFLNYWDYIKTDFSLSKYREVKSKTLAGFGLLVLTAIAVTLPVGLFVWQNPEFILSADNTIFSSDEPLREIYENFKWVVDKVVLVDFRGNNFVPWPVSIFFAIGFIKEFTHWLKKRHGHYSVVHTLTFSWLFVMLVPTLLAKEPSVLGPSIILPPIMLLSAKGIWWVIEKLNKWEYLVYPHPHKHWNGLNTGPFLAMIALLVSIALLEIF